MAVAGLHPNRPNVELINLGNEDESCPFFPVYPNDGEMTTGTFINGAPLVCGGRNPTPNNKCYTLEPEVEKFITSAQTSIINYLNFRATPG